MIQATVVCIAKVRVGMNGQVRVRFEAVTDALPNRRWSDAPPELHHDIILNREYARKFDVGEAYTLVIDLPEPRVLDVVK